MFKRILVTGGNGYLGKRISAFLCMQKDISVTVASRLLTPYEPLENVDYVAIDLCSEGSSIDEIREILANIDCVIHLAALDAPQCAASPILANDINVIGTIKLLEAAKLAGVQRFVYFSTAHIYGKPLVGEISETTLPRPVHPYAITHKSAEDYVYMAHSLGQIQGIILRLSNAFGKPYDIPSDSPDLIVNDVCRQIMDQGKIILRTAGLQYRNFITITDVTRATKHCVDMKSVQIGDGIFNLGGEKSLKIIEMAQLIINMANKLFNRKITLQTTKLTNSKIEDELFYSIAKLKATNFQLKNDVMEELEEILLFYNENTW